MLIQNLKRVLPIAAICASLAACASPDPVAYRELPSSPQLRSNPANADGRVPYKYAAQARWRSYESVILDPVDIYRGRDHQFDDLSEADKLELADHMWLQFSDKLSKSFRLATAPAPATLRIKLTLTGAETNTAVLSTFTRFDIGGGIYNGVQAARGREGMMSGSVIYSVEVYDAHTGQLLLAEITKQYPGAYDIGATVGSLAAAKAGIEKGAEALAAELR